MNGTTAGGAAAALRGAAGGAAGAANAGAPISPRARGGAAPRKQLAPWQVWEPPPSSNKANKLYIGCAICLGTLSRPVELGCGHSFCWVCLANSPKTHTCPLCRKVHILDPAMLRERRDSFRKGYRAWRQGRAHGARGEVTNIARPTRVAGRNVAPETSGSVRHDLAGVGVGEEAMGEPNAEVAPAPMLVAENEDLSIAEMLSGMAPPVPLANVDDNTTSDVASTMPQQDAQQQQQQQQQQQMQQQQMQQQMQMQT
jgi:hypothetical protein